MSNDDEPDNKFVALTQYQYVNISKYTCVIIEINDKIITNVPKNIISIRFIHKFNLLVVNLLENFKYLVLDSAFNHPVNNIQ